MSSINRQAHVLQAEKTLAIPRHVIFFDCETIMHTLPNGDIEHELKLGWVCYLRKGDSDRSEVREWLEFTDLDEFWNFIEDHVRPKSKLWVISHNLNFDFTIVKGFKYLYANKYKLRFFYNSGVTTIIKVYRKGSSILFVDSLNWFKESLEVLGNRLGFPKLKIDFDTATVFELSIYCKRDVEIIIAAFKALVKFLEVNKISRLCFTIGSTAMAAYLFRHYDEKIYIHNNEQAINLERASYKGGRTECFYLGELNDGPYYILDVNSLYPFVMRNHAFPVSYNRFCRKMSVDGLAIYLKKFAVVAEVVIKTDSPVYALKQKRTLFPVGTFTVTLTTGELKYALCHNHIVSINLVVLYDQAKIFTSYVDRFYALRQTFKVTDQPLFEHFCKILLNSLYGKFGQKAEIWKKVGDCPGEPDRIEDIIDVESHRRRKLRYLLGEIFEMTSFEESRHSFPGIAAHVTAYARLYLWHLMEVAGRENVFYCDTDSLFVNTRGRDNLSPFYHDTEIGKLKLEYTTDKIIIHGLKDYVTDTKICIKGIRKNALQIGDVVFEQEQWPTLRGLLRNKTPEKYTTIKRTKELKREYLKGTVMVSGRIEPYSLNEPD